MAYYRRYFRRRYRRYGYRRYRNVTQQSIKARIEGIYDIEYPPANAPGKPCFRQQGVLVQEISFNNVLVNSSYFNDLRKIWGYLKVTGAAYTCWVSPKAFQSGNAPVAKMAYITLILGSPGQDYNIADVKANNNTSVLTVNGITHKYIALRKNMQMRPILDLHNLGGFYLDADENSDNTNSCEWKCRLSLYVYLSKSQL